tara:strand:+ start:568 stop:1059 length:492 start_codon:yes stop_codon:yes gene_type:complete
MNIKKFSICLFLTLFIFIIDRISKLYILNIADITGSVDIYISSYLNFYLIWNKGIAFGFFSFEENLIYHLITTLIILITLIIVFIIIKTNDYRTYFLVFILGGSCGNLFDRIYYSSVPDFIDFHINDFHWFIFNVADIFITTGVFCLIFVEIFYKKNVNKQYE